MQTRSTKSYAAQGARTNTWTEEGTEMKLTWRQVLTGSVVAIVLSGLGILETESSRVRVDPVSPAPAASNLEDQRTTPWQEFLIKQGELLNIELGPRADWEIREPATTPGRQ
jgi:hypothetical protein